MPHGLDVRADGLLGVTNYVDNSLRVVQLPLASIATCDSSRVAAAVV
jgi:hypothetical protein